MVQFSLAKGKDVAALVVPVFCRIQRCETSSMLCDRDIKKEKEKEDRDRKKKEKKTRGTTSPGSIYFIDMLPSRALTVKTGDTTQRARQLIVP